MRVSGLAVAAAFVFFLSPPAASQALTDDQLLELFENQRDAHKAVKSGFGRTRGLTLITLGDDTRQTEGPVLPEVSAGSPGLANPSTAGEMANLTPDAATVGATASPVGLTPPAVDQIALAETVTPAATSVETVGIFPAALQVNVQIRFDFDSAKLNADQTPQLAQLCSVMRKSDIGLFQIIGHTDASGGDTYNERLSQLRAEEVQRYFVSDCGIDAERLKAVGMGKRALRDRADPYSGENRRVEFQALS